MKLRRVFILLVIILISFLFSGCSVSDNEDNINIDYEEYFKEVDEMDTSISSVSIEGDFNVYKIEDSSNLEFLDSIQSWLNKNKNIEILYVVYPSKNMSTRGMTIYFRESMYKTENHVYLSKTNTNFKGIRTVVPILSTNEDAYFYCLFIDEYDEDDTEVINEMDVNHVNYGNNIDNIKDVDNPENIGNVDSIDSNDLNNNVNEVN